MDARDLDMLKKPKQAENGPVDYEQPEIKTDRTTDDLISRAEAIDALGERPMVWVESDYELGARNQYDADVLAIETVPSAQPMQKRGEWILDRSGAYCCSECMEPCAGYVMMKPRDKFCKMCGAKMEVMG